MFALSDEQSTFGNKVSSPPLFFGTKLYKQIVGIPMGRNCAPLVADLL